MNKKDEKIDLETDFILVRKSTGEVMNISMLVQDARKSGWEKAYAELLSVYIECGGTQVTKFLAYLITEHNGKNEILGTQEVLAVRAKVSISTVKKTMSILQSKDMIKKIHAGVYMLSPMMLRNGDSARGAMLLRLWGDLK